MHPLPRNFLIKFAQRYALSPEQHDAFVELYSGNGDELEVAEALQISDFDFRIYMTEVYEKFDISGKRGAKFYKLQTFLWQEYQAVQDTQQLTQQIRNALAPSIRDRCGVIRVIGIPQPIPLAAKESLTSIQFHVRSSQADEKELSGLEAAEQYHKLIVIGQPGTGKTTFLQSLALQCIEGNFQAERVPFWISLRDFSESTPCDLPAYITQQLETCGVTNAQDKVQQVLQQGLGLILLDGLDAIRVEKRPQVLQQIQQLSAQLQDNPIVITCRTTARECIFEDFIEVEIAKFNSLQTANFIEAWFRSTKLDEAFSIANYLIDQLRQNPSIQAIANNPISLALLCLGFSTTHRLPTNRLELYEQGIEALLNQWDNRYLSEGDQVYRQLSPLQKEALLRQISLTALQQHDYCFQAESLEESIKNYIRSLPNIDSFSDNLALETKAILKSIEVQHGLLVQQDEGLYSFSQLPIQEYFAARAIANAKDSKSLENLVERITNQRWRNVFLQVAQMLPNADQLLSLMKREIDALVASDQDLQRFLVWIHQQLSAVRALDQSIAAKTSYVDLCLDLWIESNPARALDLGHALTQARLRDRIHALSHIRDLLLELEQVSAFDRTRDHARNLDLFLDLDLARAQSLALNRARIHARALAQTVDRDLAHLLDPEMKRSLQQLKNQLPDPNGNQEIFQQWWEANGQNWAKELKTLVVEYVLSGQSWHFSDEQKERLRQYYDATKLLVDCLHVDCTVSPGVRQTLENTLLLSVTEIEHRK